MAMSPSLAPPSIAMNGSEPPRTPSPTPVHSYGSLPSLPRVVIPPPLPPSCQPYANPLITPSSYSHSIPVQQPRDNRALTAFVHLLPASDWRYESRRTAQQVLPNLFLGPISASKDESFLRSNNIGQVIAVRMGRKLVGQNGQNAVSGVDYHSIEVGSLHELNQNFPRIAELIDEFTVRNLAYTPPSHESAQLSQRDLVTRLLLSIADGTTNMKDLQGMGRTLLYCETGNDRSAAAAVAYVMQVFEVDTVRAVQYVQSRRFCITFTEEMKGQLITFEGLVKARRDVMKASAPTANGNMNGIPVPGAAKPSKRRASEEDDDVPSMGREGIAPFADRSNEQDVRNGSALNMENGLDMEIEMEM